MLIVPTLGIILACVHGGPFHTLSTSSLWHLVGTTLKSRMDELEPSGNLSM